MARPPRSGAAATACRGWVPRPRSSKRSFAALTIYRCRPRGALVDFDLGNEREDDLPLLDPRQRIEARRGYVSRPRFTRRAGSRGAGLRARERRRCAMRALRNAWRPTGVAGGFIADLTRSCADLIAEDALL